MLRTVARLVPLGLVLATITLGFATAADAHSSPAPNNDSDYRVAIPAEAESMGFSDRLSLWYQSEGVLHVGLTSVTGKETATLKAKFGIDVEVFQAERFATMEKRTPISATTQIRSVPVPTKSSLVGRAQPRLQSSSVNATPGNYPPFLDSEPYWGGDRIVSFQGIYMVQCTTTAAYGLLGGLDSMLTAGHCGSSGVQWYQGYFDGSNVLVSGVMGEAGAVHFGNSDIDAELLYPMNGAPTYGPAIWTGANSYFIVSGTSTMFAGAAVCTDGSFTGHICGATVSDVNICANVDENGTIVTVCGLDRATAAVSVVQSGDSGGPVLAQESGSYAGIAGTISAGTPDGKQVLFTDGNRVTEVMGILPAT